MRTGLLALVLAAAIPLSLSGQSLKINTIGDTVHVVSPGLDFIAGRVLDRLRNGASVRVDFELVALDTSGGPLTESRRSFNLSFDLWEQRFAVTRLGAPPRSVTHLRVQEAEDWCLANLTLPRAALSRPGRDSPFWIRLAYRILDRVPATDGQASGLSLRGLVDALSRNRQDDDLGRSMEAGPFRLTD